MNRLGYIRTSTHSQLIDRQYNLLKAECDEVFIEDGVSAVRKYRPVYDKVMGKLQPGDVFVVLSLDRAFRSVLDALNELEKLHHRDIAFLSLTQNIQTNTPEGKLMYTVIAALAEWERSILSERTKQGMEAARLRGRQIGRPRKLTEAQISWAVGQLEANNCKASVCKKLDVSSQTLERSINRK